MNFLYECTVSHCRLKPKRHAFDYRVFMLSVDLDALPMLSVAGFSHNRFNLFSINDRDHVELGKVGGIKANLLHWLKGRGRSCQDDCKVRLVTFPQVLGYGFNPVSFYYVSDASGELLCVVAEVVNTFREMKLYLIDRPLENQKWHLRVSKDFYVSPFSDPGAQFDFTLGLPGESWQVNIDTYTDGERTLMSSMHGQRRELNSLRLVGYAFKYPLLSLRIIGLIHWHALLLWIRRVPFFRKSERTEAQNDVLRPHRSLKRNLP